MYSLQEYAWYDPPEDVDVDPEVETPEDLEKFWAEGFEYLATGEKCPSCKANLRDKPIPEKYQEYYGNLKYYSRLTLICDENIGCTIAWKCPDCLYSSPSRRAFSLEAAVG